jgi:arylformamidase
VRLVDVGGALKHRMWPVEGNPFPLVEVAELPSLPHLTYAVYAQTVFTPMQASTYLETAAHMDPSRIKIDELPLERLVTEAVVLKIPLGADAHITPALIQAALQEADERLRPGDSLLIGTGWDMKWDDPDYLLYPPHFTGEAIDWIVRQRVGVLGCDSPLWDGRRDPQNFFPRFFQSDTLLLAPLVNLFAVQRPRVRLLTLPLKVAGVCAAPCRAIVMED